MNKGVSIAELNSSEREWLAAHLQVARSFVEAYAADPAQKALTPDTLDAAWSTWLPTAADQPDVVNTIINATGAALGQFLVDTAGFRWVVASDADGTEMAVTALQGTADALVYPMNLVGKRYATRETGFIVPVLSAIQRQIRKVS